MISFWNLFEGEITEVYTCTSCKSTIARPESINYLLLHFPGDNDKKCDSVQSLIEFNLRETDVEDYNCPGCKKKTSATTKSSITKFPSFMCILLCRSIGDSAITSAVEFPALGFDIKGDQMPYDLSATVHHKPAKGAGKGHYTAISRSRNLQSQEWFIYDDDRVSSVNFTKTHKNQTVVQKRFTKQATILFYVSPSIETRIKKSQTIDLMEGGKEQAQNVPNSEINPCDGAGNEGHADGSSRDVVPIQSESEGAKKKTVDICEDGEEGTADGSSDKNDKKDDDEEEERESGEVESSSGEESSSEAFVPPRKRHRFHRYRNRNTFSGSSDSSSHSSDSSSDS
jgi:ribosomal protein L37AE/L43A